VHQARHRWILLIPPLLAAVFWGCGSAQLPIQGASPEPGITAVVYWVPGASPQGDGTLWVREVDSVTQQQVAGDRLMASGTDFWPVDTHGSTPPIAWEVAVTTGSGTLGLPVNTTGTKAPAWADANADRRISAIAPDGTVAFAPEGKRVVTLAPGGVVQSFALPPVRIGDGSAFKGPPVGGPVGAVGAILFAPNGHLVAAEHNGVNSELVDLTIGRSLDLLGYSFVEGMAVAPDGTLYVLVFDERLSSNPYVFVVVSDVTWSILRVVPTPFIPGSSYPVSSVTLAATSNAIFLDAIYGITAPGLQGHRRLFDLPYRSSAVSEVSVPDRVGLKMQPGSDGILRFYGGSGRDQVTPFDPSTGVFGQATASAHLAPTGAYIGAVFS
jgi:hypothetical protein